MKKKTIEIGKTKEISYVITSYKFTGLIYRYYFAHLKYEIYEERLTNIKTKVLNFLNFKIQNFIEEVFIDENLIK